MVKLGFKPKQVVRSLISVLPKRAQDVIKKRYGIEEEKKYTLESIGGMYGITRERVRQIENFSLNTIRKSASYGDCKTAFEELLSHMKMCGSVVHEKHFLDYMSNDSLAQNHIVFLLNVSDMFTRLREDDHFHHRWTVDEKFCGRIHEALHRMCDHLTEKDVLTESEIVARLVGELKAISKEEKDEERIKRWLLLSKRISSNPLGDWGVVGSPSISIRGMKDYAFLVLRRHGSPMHFSEVARAISDVFGKKAHVATCHNELIKDDRFVLVGRGLYALTSWGYQSGTVRDIIRGILQKEGPLTRDQLVVLVLKERYVKENTIGVNLQDRSLFKRDSSGKYFAV